MILQQEYLSQLRCCLLATGTSEPFTGTRWLALPIQGAPPNQVFLQCLGDIEGPRFLDGRTEIGTVGLAPDTAAIQRHPLGGERCGLG